jgi:hypothetical protein
MFSDNLQGRGEHWDEHVKNFIDAIGVIVTHQAVLIADFEPGDEPFDICPFLERGDVFLE